jgi:hypothetical protein
MFIQAYYLVGLICVLQRFQFRQNGLQCVFLRAFAKLQKAMISFVKSVRPSVRMEEFVSHYTDVAVECFSKICRQITTFIKICQYPGLFYIQKYIYI